MNKRISSSDVAGWAGMAILLAAYILNSLGALTLYPILYQAMNAIGAVGIAISTAAQKAKPATVLNILWFIFAVGAILKILHG